MWKDTIAAIATGVGESGIGIVRISGPGTREIIQALFRSHGGRTRRFFAPRYLYLGYIADEDGQVLDQVLVTFMPAPASYTGEDVAEINTHGGAMATREVLALVLRSGARMAVPGEFTERAFLNGKLDLVQAEAVIDLIQAKTARALKQAGKLIKGELSQRVADLRFRVLDLLATVAAAADFPEHDVPEITASLLEHGVSDLLSEIRGLLSTGFAGRILREGLQVAIVGRPNVGKSSLLNALAGRERAIVTDIPGTTRDIVDDYINVAGIPVRLADTAGLRKTEDPVERIGVGLAEEMLQEADLVLLVIDQSQPLTEEDRSALAALRNQNRFVILNKDDLPVGLGEIDRELLREEQVFSLSALHKAGLKELQEAMEAFVLTGIREPEDPFLANLRQEGLLQEAAEALRAAQKTIAEGWPADMIQVDLQAAALALGTFLGLDISFNLAEEIFSRFCIGK